MLYCYPVNATKDNWLQASLIIILRRIHRAIGRGVHIPNWDDLVPTNYLDRLKSRTGLRNRITEYAEAFESLSNAERSKVVAALPSQNCVPQLVAGTKSCECVAELPEAIREPAKKVGAEAFRLLTEFEIRDEQYRRIYETLRHKVCPFCGIGHFGSPQSHREDLDHYLPRTKYPFAAANLKNLPPMCDSCNTDYKRDVDPIRNSHGARQAVYPYGGQTFVISLLQSQPFSSSLGSNPLWQIDIVPSLPESSTWDDIFSIRARYTNDFLNPYYRVWLDEFGGWCKSAQLSPSSREDLLDAVDRYLVWKHEDPLEGRNFLKAAVFELLYDHCNNGNQRVIDLLFDVVAMNN